MVGLFLGLGIGVLMLYGPASVRRWARLWLTVVVCGNLFLASDIGSGLWSAPLLRHEGFITSAGEAGGATAVVVLTPSGSAFRARGVEIGIIPDAIQRLLETVRVYRLLGDPWVILQGGVPGVTDRPSAGQVSKDTLIRFGIPADRIIVEPRSRNTYEHTLELRPLLTEHGIERFVLVTSADHMWRSASTFRKAGYTFVTSAAATHSDYPSDHSRIRPGAGFLRASLAASHEYVGLLYYWWKGRL
jgi:uncharacterized SAM-binding protein YcdF (DUF218 family)